MPVILPARCGSTFWISGKSRSPSSCFCCSGGAAASVAALISCGAICGGCPIGPPGIGAPGCPIGAPGWPWGAPGCPGGGPPGRCGKP
eukprot:scaffold16516_cov57-Phaeocystis_antarctica.AAC.3